MQQRPDASTSLPRHRLSIFAYSSPHGKSGMKCGVRNTGQPTFGRAHSSPVLGLRSLDLLGISAGGSDAAQPPQLEWGYSYVTDLVRRTKLDCPHAMGTDALSALVFDSCGANSDRGAVPFGDLGWVFGSLPRTCPSTPLRAGWGYYLPSLTGLCRCDLGCRVVRAARWAGPSDSRGPRSQRTPCRATAGYRRTWGPLRLRSGQALDCA